MKSLRVFLFLMVFISLFSIFSGYVSALPSPTITINTTTVTTGDSAGFNVTIVVPATDHNITEITVNYTMFNTSAANISVFCPSQFGLSPGAIVAGHLKCTNSTPEDGIYEGQWANITFVLVTAPVAANATVGQYYINVTAVDNSSVTTQEKFDMKVIDNDLPAVSLVTPSPPAGEYGSRNVTFNCSATDNTGLSAINISVYFPNGTLYQSLSRSRVGTSNYTNLTIVFTKDILNQSNPTNTFYWNCSANDTSGNSIFTPNPPGRVLQVAVSDLHGFVRNSTGSLVEGVNVSIYRFIQQQTGPPVEEYVASNTTATNGNFTIYDVNVSVGQTGPPNFKFYFTLNNSRGNATEVGPNLPPFPREMVFKEVLGMVMQGPPGMPVPGINGSTIYLQPAGTLKLSAYNASGSALYFGYEIIDQSLGFPIKSCVQCNVSSIDVAVPRDRNYSVMFVRDPQSFSPGPTCQPGVVFPVTCPTPPMTTNINNVSDYSAYDYVVNVSMDMSFSEHYINGYIAVSGNTSQVNVTKIISKLIPWPGFIPPVEGGRRRFNASTDLNRSALPAGKIAYFEIPAGGSSGGINYLVEFYGNGATGEYFAAFQNITVYETNASVNVTLTKLAGTYTTGTDVNTSKVLIQLQNSTGGNITTDAHVEVEVKHSSTYGGSPVHYIIETLSNGSFSMAFLNDSTVRVMVFSQEYAPQVRRINLTNNVTNITLQKFDMEFMNGTSGNFEDFNTSMKQSFMDIRFYRYNSACNVVLPSSSCQLGPAFSGMFDPFQAMLAGKSNLRIRLTSTNITLYFINVDLLASGPPDAQMSEAATSTTSTASSLEQAWKFGSLAPDIYDYVWVGIPYSEATITETWSFNVSVPYLYDESWNLIWNVTTQGTNPGATYHEYSDYSTDWFTGITCSKTDSTANCYMNTTGNYFWIKIPHFSGVQSTLTGTAPAAAEEAPSPAPSGPSYTTNITVGKVTKTYSSITPFTPKKITAADLDASGTHLTEIYISVHNRVTSVEITIEKLPKQPADVTINITGNVYKYINITKKNLDDENIKKGWMKFKVEKSWITDNHIDKATIALHRWHANKWNKLSTSEIDEDDDYIYYKADVPGFSYFAVSGEVEKTECPYECCVGEEFYEDKACASGYECKDNECVAIPACIEDWECTEWSECTPENIQTRTCIDKNNCGTEINKPAESQSCLYIAPGIGIPTILLVAIIVIVGILGFVFWKKFK